MHKSSFRDFIDNNSASAAIEFALVCPLFLLLLLGIIELALMSFGNSVINNTMLHATRQAMIGSYGGSNAPVTEASIRAMILRNSAGLVNFNNGNGSISAYVITPDRFANFPILDGVDKLLSGAGLGIWGVDAAINSRGTIVIYEVRYNWPRFFRYLSNIGIFTPITNYRSFSVVPHMG